jgi:hypothetical protein
MTRATRRPMAARGRTARGCRCPGTPQRPETWRCRHVQRLDQVIDVAPRDGPDPRFLDQRQSGRLARLQKGWMVGPLGQLRENHAHLIDRLAREAEQACCLTPAPTFHEDRLSNPQIKLHDFHAPALRPVMPPRHQWRGFPVTSGRASRTRDGQCSTPR